jgi:hypothetical protein
MIFRLMLRLMPYPTPLVQAPAKWVASKPAGLAAMALTSTTGPVKGTFNVSNEKAMREGLEIVFVPMNGSTFRGSVTLQEVKIQRLPWIQRHVEL